MFLLGLEQVELMSHTGLSELENAILTVMGRPLGRISRFRLGEELYGDDIFKIHELIQDDSELKRIDYNDDELRSALSNLLERDLIGQAFCYYIINKEAPIQKLISMPWSLTKQISKYRYDNQLPSEAEAVCRLIQKGLDAEQGDNETSS